MKNLPSIFLMIMILSAPAAFATHHDELLTAEDQKLVLTTMDDQCADSWCEGDYNYRFNWIGCSVSRSQCALRFTLVDTDAHEWATHCMIPGVRSVEDVLEKDPHTTTLNEKFNELLTRCFTKRQHEFKDHIND